MGLLERLGLRKDWSNVERTLLTPSLTIDTTVGSDRHEVGPATRQVMRYDGRTVVPAITPSLSEPRYSEPDPEVTYKVGSLTPEALARYNAQDPNQPFQVTDADIAQCGRIKHKILERNGTPFRVLSFIGTHTVMGAVVRYEFRVEDRTYQDGVEVPTRVSVIETCRPFPKQARNPEGIAYNLREEVTRIVQERLGGGVVNYGSR